MKGFIHFLTSEFLDGKTFVADDIKLCNCLYRTCMGACPRLVGLFFVVGEVATQVVLALILLHQLVHLLVPGVLLEVGVGTRDGPLQVIQLGVNTELAPLLLRVSEIDNHCLSCVQ